MSSWVSGILVLAALIVNILETKCLMEKKDRKQISQRAFAVVGICLSAILLLWTIVRIPLTPGEVLDGGAIIYVATYFYYMRQIKV